jgi:hypothetical protein
MDGHAEFAPRKDLQVTTARTRPRTLDAGVELWIYDEIGQGALTTRDFTPG